MGSGIWPGWQSKEDDRLQPWSTDFDYPTGMAADSAYSKLTSTVKGFWCAYPYRWTHGQNNHDPKIPTEVIVENELQAHPKASNKLSKAETAEEESPT
jgi:hypothetical protein